MVRLVSMPVLISPYIWLLPLSETDEHAESRMSRDAVSRVFMGFLSREAVFGIDAAACIAGYVAEKYVMGWAVVRIPMGSADAGH